MQIIICMAISNLLLKVVFELTTIRFFSIIESLPILFALILLAARLVRLQWHVGTLQKSVRKIKWDSEDKIDALRVRLLSEIDTIQKNNGSTHEASKRRPSIRSGIQLKPISSSGPAVGRYAAGTQDAPDRDVRLYDLLNQRLTPGGPTELMGVVSPKFKKILAAEFQLKELAPSIISQQVQDSTATMMIIDEQAFRSGVWFGADSASGTLLFDRLVQAIDLANDLQIAIWFVSTEAAPREFTNELKKLATGILGFEALDKEWSEDIHIKLHESISEYLSPSSVCAAFDMVSERQADDA